jgi:hypothetical protein
MVTIYREKSAFKRLGNNILEAFEDSRLGRLLDKHWQVWKTDRYIKVWKTYDWYTPPQREAIPIYRIRFWPIHLLQIVGIWIGYNALLLAWFMISFLAGRSVSFTPIDGLHAPLIWFMEFLR